MIFRVSPRLLSTSDHVGRIIKGFQPNKVFFNASHAHEAVEDSNAACLVVCSACPATTKWLLAYYSARTLFVVVHVPSGVTKFVGCLDQSLTLGGKAERFREISCIQKDKSVLHVHSTSEGIVRRSIDEFERFIKITIVIHINLGKKTSTCGWREADLDQSYSDNRTKDFFSHCDGLRVPRENDSWLHEVTLRVIG